MVPEAEQTGPKQRLWLGEVDIMTRIPFCFQAAQNTKKRRRAEKIQNQELEQKDNPELHFYHFWGPVKTRLFLISFSTNTGCYCSYIECCVLSLSLSLTFVGVALGLFDTPAFKNRKVRKRHYLITVFYTYFIYGHNLAEITIHPYLVISMDHK